jgi:hypothetical protein
VLSGEVTVSFRLWHRPKVKAGGRYRVGGGRSGSTPSSRSPSSPSTRLTCDAPAKPTSDPSADELPTPVPSVTAPSFTGSSSTSPARCPASPPSRWVYHCALVPVLLRIRLSRRLVRALAEAQAAPARVAHAPVTGPLGEPHLADELRPDPVRAAGMLGRERRAERAGRGLQRTQPADQVSKHGLGETGSDMPGVPQAPAVVNAEQQGADRVRPPSPARCPAADDDLGVPEVLDLDPVPALPRIVVRRKRLADDAFQAVGQADGLDVARAAAVPRRCPDWVLAEAGQPVPVIISASAMNRGGMGRGWLSVVRLDQN